MKKSRISDAPAAMADLCAMDLSGRPFLQEQGNTVTRGFVAGLDVSDSHWQMTVRDVELLDKSNGRWRPDTSEDQYGGALKITSARRFWDTRTPETDLGVEIDCYGVFIHIGRASETPWADNDWPELDTDWLEPGPMWD